MKRMIAIAIFAAAGFIAVGSAAATTPQQAHYQTVQFTVPPVPVMDTCFVNGVSYPVDFNYRIWGINGYGNWFVIGRIVTAPNGPIAVRNDGLRFPAVCQ